MCLEVTDLQQHLLLVVVAVGSGLPLVHAAASHVLMPSLSVFRIASQQLLDSAVHIAGQLVGESPNQQVRKDIFLAKLGLDCKV